MLMIAATLSNHAVHQAQRRGISATTLELVLAHADRSQKLRGGACALWVSRRKRKSLTQHGLAPSDVDRTSGVRLIVSLRDDVIITVEHIMTRRYCA